MMDVDCEILRVAAPLESESRTSPLPLCLTPEAAQVIAETVGSRRPETGAKLFGPIDRFGVDHVEFDYGGSFPSRSTVYEPDVAWGTERVEFHLSQDPPRLWTGDVHSHPAGVVHPSTKSGPGRGDLGYVERFFESNAAPEYYALPIILPANSAEPPQIAPWIASRSDPLRPMLAELQICPVEDFPQRTFNPQWLDEVASAGGETIHDQDLLVDLIQQLLRRRDSGGDSIVLAESNSGLVFAYITGNSKHSFQVAVDAGQSKVRISVASKHRGQGLFRLGLRLNSILERIRRPLNQDEVSP